MAPRDVDSKVSWTVVKFVIEATGLQKKGARELLRSISEDHYTRLYTMARSWDLEAKSKAAKTLEELVQDSNIEALKAVTRRAQMPAGAPPEPPERPRSRPGMRRPPKR